MRRRLRKKLHLKEFRVYGLCVRLRLVEGLASQPTWWHSRRGRSLISGTMCDARRRPVLSRRLLIAAALVSITAVAGCAADRLDEEQIEVRDGIAYARGSDVPFSGTAFRDLDTGGVAREVEYSHGLRHGTYTLHYDAVWENRPAKRFTYARGVLHGSVRYWNEFGCVWFRGSYDRGQPHGTCVRYFDSGQKLGEVTFDHGKLRGTLTLWYENGQERLVVALEPDSRSGSFQSWGVDGTPTAHGSVVDGILGSPDGRSIDELAGLGFLDPPD